MQFGLKERVIRDRKELKYWIQDKWLHCKSFILKMLYYIFRIKCRGKRVYYINCSSAYFRAINLPWIKSKKQFLKNYQKFTKIFGYIIINRIQHFEGADISGAFFLCRPMMKQNICKIFFDKFQDEFSCALAKYSYMWVMSISVYIYVYIYLFVC